MNETQKAQGKELALKGCHAAVKKCVDECGKGYQGWKDLFGKDEAKEMYEECMKNCQTILKKNRDVTDKKFG